MSRSCYSEDFGDDFPGQLKLFRANVERSIKSKKGQARLRELREALLALSEKRLAQDIFVDPAEDGGAPRVCGLGAWAVSYCGGDMQAAAEMVRGDADDEETVAALGPKGWPRLVVMDAIYENDRDAFDYVTVEGPQESPYARYPLQYRRDETDEERYVRVLAWVERQLNPCNT